MEKLFQRHLTNKKRKRALSKYSRKKAVPKKGGSLRKRNVDKGDRERSVSPVEVIKRLYLEIEKQELQYEQILGKEVKFYWTLFISLQLVTMLYVSVIISIMDLNILENRWIQVFIASGFTVFMTLTISITNSVGGRWLHGTLYQLIMPFKGGFYFLLFQALAWSLFSFALVLTIVKLFDLTFFQASQSRTYMRFAGLFGFLAEISLVTSLILFKGERNEDKQANQGPPQKEDDCVWEECEDDEGNVYYYNTSTKQTSTSLPDGLREAS
eukprot:snap_masked-scaffold_12-processed-gene-5.56-mRNA-1 protein AED:1.00 eAED:1.00 QI:0/-1/0/0/-1/1/1/0/268